MSKAVKSHALSVSSHILMQSYTLMLTQAFLTHWHFFIGKVLPFKLSEVLMNSEFVPSLALNFG